MFSGQKPPEDEAATQPPAEDVRPRHTVGALLRETRESYGGDIERIAAALRIRAPYLVALEEGRYDRLPAPVYALGFVRAYAIHLGLDGEEAVRRFKQEASGFEIPRDLVFPVPLADRSIPRRPILAAAVLLLLVAYGAWYYLSSGNRARPERVSEVPAALLPADKAPAKIAETPPVAPTAIAPAATAPANTATTVTPPTPALTVSKASAPPVTPTPPPAAPGQQSASSALPPAAEPQNQTASLPPPTGDAHIFGVTDGPARIELRAIDDSWLQVRDRDSSLFQRLMKAGDVYRVPDRPGLSLMTGNAGGLEITVDGKPVPALGGRVRHNVRLDPDRLKAGNAVID